MSEALAQNPDFLSQRADPVLAERIDRRLGYRWEPSDFVVLPFRGLPSLAIPLSATSRQMLRAGIESASQGARVDLGSFASYADDDEA
jgi:hypothetical protein